MFAACWPGNTWHTPKQGTTCGDTPLTLASARRVDDEVRIAACCYHYVLRTAASDVPSAPNSDVALGSMLGGCQGYAEGPTG